MTKPLRSAVLTLAEHLLARVAEDEALALAASKGRDPSWAGWAVGPVSRHTGLCAVKSQTWPAVHVAREAVPPDAAHVAQWDPARVLAECEAKRRLIETGDETVLRALARVYEDDRPVAWLP